MRITILYNRDLYSNEALNHLLPKLLAHDITLLYSHRVGAKAQRDPRLDSLAFVEQDFFLNTLFPMLDASSRTGERLTFMQLAKHCGTTEIPVENINAAEGIALLEAASPDLIVSIRFGQILKEQAIATPPLGVLNLHSGLLPAYRGVMATFRAMQARDSHIGLTLHWIDSPAIDKGGIIERLAIPPDHQASYLRNVYQLYAPGAKLLETCIDQLDGGQALSTEVAKGQDAYFSFPDTDALDAFENDGYRLFDNRDIQTIGGRFLA